MDKYEAVERIARRILWTALVVGGLPIAVIMLVIAVQDAPKLLRFYSGTRVGLWGMVAGLPVLWCSILVMYFRSSKEMRNQDMGRLAGVARLMPFLRFFKLYRQQRGLDVFVWMMLASGTWCVVILWITGWDVSQRDDPFLFWLGSVSVLWIAFFTWLVMFTPPKAE